MLTISRNKTPVKFKYCLHGHVLEFVDKAKYLGVTISEDLKWESLISNICAKANKTLGFLGRNLNIGSTSVKEQTYI
jgi:2C-methyl-D-erythritol 2,4-cyclodiphosphate synthase